MSTATGVPFRAIEMGRGGYNVDKLKRNLTVLADGGYAYSIMDAILFGCDTVLATSLERCQKSLGTQQPTYILINIGVNDVGFVPPWGAPNETTWKADTRTVRNTLHAQWPDAKIYYTLPWKRQQGGDETVFDTLATWITSVAAEESYTFLLDDERDWFETNANGAGNYCDDTPSGWFIHYNPLAGQQAAADAKFAALPPLP